MVSLLKFRALAESRFTAFLLLALMATSLRAAETPAPKKSAFSTLSENCANEKNSSDANSGAASNNGGSNSENAGESDTPQTTHGNSNNNSQSTSSQDDDGGSEKSANSNGSNPQSSNPSAQPGTAPGTELGCTEAQSDFTDAVGKMTDAELEKLEKELAKAKADAKGDESKIAELERVEKLLEKSEGYTRVKAKTAARVRQEKLDRERMEAEAASRPTPPSTETPRAGGAPANAQQAQRAQPLLANPEVRNRMEQLGIHSGNGPVTRAEAGRLADSINSGKFTEGMSADLAAQLSSAARAPMALDETGDLFLSRADENGKVGVVDRETLMAQAQATGAAYEKLGFKIDGATGNPSISTGSTIDLSRLSEDELKAAGLNKVRNAEAPVALNAQQILLPQGNGKFEVIATSDFGARQQQSIRDLGTRGITFSEQNGLTFRDGEAQRAAIQTLQQDGSADRRALEMISPGLADITLGSAVKADTLDAMTHMAQDSTSASTELKKPEPPKPGADGKIDPAAQKVYEQQKEIYELSLKRNTLLAQAVSYSKKIQQRGGSSYQSLLTRTLNEAQEVTQKIITASANLAMTGVDPQSTIPFMRPHFDRLASLNRIQQGMTPGTQGALQVSESRALFADSLKQATFIERTGRIKFRDEYPKEEEGAVPAYGLAGASGKATSEYNEQFYALNGAKDANDTRTYSTMDFLQRHRQMEGQFRNAFTRFSEASEDLYNSRSLGTWLFNPITGDYTERQNGYNQFYGDLGRITARTRALANTDPRFAALADMQEEASRGAKSASSALREQTYDNAARAAKIRGAAGVVTVLTMGAGTALFGSGAAATTVGAGGRTVLFTTAGVSGRSAIVATISREAIKGSITGLGLYGVDQESRRYFDGKAEYSLAGAAQAAGGGALFGIANKFAPAPAEAVGAFLGYQAGREATIAAMDGKYGAMVGQGLQTLLPIAGYAWRGKPATAADMTPGGPGTPREVVAPKWMDSVRSWVTDAVNPRRTTTPETAGPSTAQVKVSTPPTSEGDLTIAGVRKANRPPVTSGEDSSATSRASKPAAENSVTAVPSPTTGRAPALVADTPLTAGSTPPRANGGDTLTSTAESSPPPRTAGRSTPPPASTGETSPTTTARTASEVAAGTTRTSTTGRAPALVADTPLTAGSTPQRSASRAPVTTPDTPATAEAPTARASGGDPAKTDLTLAGVRDGIEGSALSRLEAAKPELATRFKNWIDRIAKSQPEQAPGTEGYAARARTLAISAFERFKALKKQLDSAGESTLAAAVDSNGDKVLNDMNTGARRNGKAGNNDVGVAAPRSFQGIRGGAQEVRIAAGLPNVEAINVPVKELLARNPAAAEQLRANPEVSEKLMSALESKEMDALFVDSDGQLSVLENKSAKITYDKLYEPIRKNGKRMIDQMTEHALIADALGMRKYVAATEGIDPAASKVLEDMGFKVIAPEPEGRVTVSSEAPRPPTSDSASATASRAPPADVAAAEAVLGRELTPVQRIAFEDAHQFGFGQPGRAPETRAGINPDGSTNFTDAQITGKYRRLLSAFSSDDARALMGAGAAGFDVPTNIPRPAPPPPAPGSVNGIDPVVMSHLKENSPQIGSLLERGKRFSESPLATSIRDGVANASGSIRIYGGGKAAIVSQLSADGTVLDISIPHVGASRELSLNQNSQGANTTLIDTLSGVFQGASRRALTDPKVKTVRVTATAVFNDKLRGTLQRNGFHATTAEFTGPGASLSLEVPLRPAIPEATAPKVSVETMGEVGPRIASGIDSAYSKLRGEMAEGKIPRNAAAQRDRFVEIMREQGTFGHVMDSPLALTLKDGTPLPKELAEALVTDHHGTYFNKDAPKINSTMKLIDRMETVLTQEGGNVQKAAERIRQELGAVTTDNLADGGEALYVAQNLEKFLGSKSLRDRMLAKEMLVDFGVFGGKAYEQNPMQALEAAFPGRKFASEDVQIGIQQGRAALQLYTDIISSNGISMGDRFVDIAPGKPRPVAEQQKILTEALNGIDRIVSSPDGVFTTELANRFNRNREIATRAIAIEANKMTRQLRAALDGTEPVGSRPSSRTAEADLALRQAVAARLGAGETPSPEMFVHSQVSPAGRPGANPGESYPAPGLFPAWSGPGNAHALPYDLTLMPGIGPEGNRTGMILSNIDGRETGANLNPFGARIRQLHLQNVEARLKKAGVTGDALKTALAQEANAVAGREPLQFSFGGVEVPPERIVMEAAQYMSEIAAKPPGADNAGARAPRTRKLPSAEQQELDDIRAFGGPGARRHSGGEEAQRYFASMERPAEVTGEVAQNNEALYKDDPEFQQRRNTTVYINGMPGLRRMIDRGGHIVDLGAGEGVAAGEMAIGAAGVPKGKVRVTAVGLQKPRGKAGEEFAKSQRIANGNGKDADPNRLRYLEGDFAKDPEILAEILKAGEADGVIDAIGMESYTDQPGIGLQRSLSLLKPGGTYVGYYKPSGFQMFDAAGNPITMRKYLDSIEGVEVVRAPASQFSAPSIELRRTSGRLRVPQFSRVHIEADFPPIRTLTTSEVRATPIRNGAVVPKNESENIPVGTYVGLVSVRNNTRRGMITGRNEAGDINVVLDGSTGKQVRYPATELKEVKILETVRNLKPDETPVPGDRLAPNHATMTAIGPDARVTLTDMYGRQKTGTVSDYKVQMQDFQITTVGANGTRSTERASLYNVSAIRLESPVRLRVNPEGARETGSSGKKSADAASKDATGKITEEIELVGLDKTVTFTETGIPAKLKSYLKKLGYDLDRIHFGTVPKQVMSDLQMAGFQGETRDSGTFIATPEGKAVSERDPTILHEVTHLTVDSEKQIKLRGPGVTTYDPMGDVTEKYIGNEVEAYLGTIRGHYLNRKNSMTPQENLEYTYNERMVPIASSLERSFQTAETGLANGTYSVQRRTPTEENLNDIVIRGADGQPSMHLKDENLRTWAKDRGIDYSAGPTPQLVQRMLSEKRAAMKKDLETATTIKDRMAARNARPRPQQMRIPAPPPMEGQRMPALDTFLQIGQGRSSAYPGASGIIGKTIAMASDPKRLAAKSKIAKAAEGIPKDIFGNPLVDDPRTQTGIQSVIQTALSHLGNERQFVENAAALYVSQKNKWGWNDAKRAEIEAMFARVPNGTEILNQMGSR